MNEISYKSNSHRSREEQQQETLETKKKVEKVVRGPVKAKKNDMRKFTDIFISEDVSNVKSYIFMDVLVPAIKKAISDVVRNGIDMILYGDAGASKSGSTASKVSYRSYYDNGRDRRDAPTHRTRTGYSYDDIVLDNRGEAEEVLSRMDELVESYGIVSVADLYDLVGVTANYTDNKYGWTAMSIKGARVERVRDGYMIKLPKALPLD